MAPPVSPSGLGGSFDVIYEIGSDRMGFILSEGSRKRRASPFAVTIRVGGDPAYSAESFQQLVLKSFHHGGDLKLQEADSQRYGYSNGQVATHREGEVQLASQWASSDASWQATARMIIDFTDDNTTFAWTCVAAKSGSTRAVRVYNGTVWASAAPGAGFGANDIAYIQATDQYMFVAMGAAADFWRWDGATVSTTWAQPAVAGTKANGFVWYNATLYRFYGRQIIPATNNDGSTWGTAVDVGWSTTTIKDAYVVSGYILIAKPEGLWLYDGSTMVQMVNAADTRYNNNFVGGAEFRGEAFLPQMNKVRKSIINAARDYTFADITPTMKGSTAKVDYGHGFPLRAFGGPGDLLYVAFDDGESVYPEMLLYNGLGWHQVYRGTSGDTMYAAGYSRLQGWLLLNDGATRRKRLRSLSDAEFPDYATSGYVESAEQDVGLPDMYKAWRDVTIETRSADSLSTVLLEYNADEAGWTSAGTISDSTDPKQTIPLAGLDAVVLAKKIAFRLTLTRDPADVTDSPVVELPMVVRVLPVPEVTHVYSDTVVLNPDQPLRNNLGLVSDLYSITDMLNFVDGLERTADTIVRTGRWGERKRVKNTDLAEDEPPVEPVDSARQANIHSLTFLEVFSGLTPLAVDGLVISDQSLSFTLYGAAAWAALSVYGAGRWGLFDYGS